jgi:hypothetical protein
MASATNVFFQRPPCGTISIAIFPRSNAAIDHASPARANRGFQLANP